MAVETLYRADGTAIEVDLEDDGGGGQGSGGREDRSNSEWATLRKEKRRADEAEAKVAKYERDQAFRTAGIDPSKDPRLPYFTEGYKGDLTPEAIRAAATAAGFLAEGAPAGDPAAGAAPVGQTLTPEQQASVAAAAAIAAAAPGGSTDLSDPAVRIAEAMATGGQAAALQVMRDMGMPVVQDGQ